ncbi:uncharacterized protein LOC134273476 [Saccostrea cucullata]|uniref:uncharacterized protein LOC134273476 n=1 Tax=Saccostrea cuccullata TaxID=36930 RepID=UPI002ED1FF5D
MAAGKPKYPLGSPQEHIEMYKTHDLPIDVICEDCDEFICGKCAKTDQRDHDWNTLPNVASQRKRGLIKLLTRKIKEEDLPGIVEKLEKVTQQMTENKEMCDSEIKELQDHYDIALTESSSFKYGKEAVVLLRAVCEGSVSTVVGTGPLEPNGISQSVDGGLLVNLADKELGRYKFEPHSTRVVRHITVTGDVIHEYEYQEDGQTRLFTYPFRVTQNSYGDICVVNRTRTSTGELVIMSPSGRMKSVYRGQTLSKDFWPGNAEYDSFCNILVPDMNDVPIHLLSSDGEFLNSY